MQEKINKFKSFFNPSKDNERELCHYEICKSCGGKCCKSCGCQISPSDIKPEYLTLEGIEGLLKTELVSIDWWEGLLPTYFLRMRNTNGNEIDPSWGGTCKLLGPNGCPLEFPFRPMGARRLTVPLVRSYDSDVVTEITATKPSRNNPCIENYSKKDCVDEWDTEELQGILRELIYKYY